MRLAERVWFRMQKRELTLAEKLDRIQELKARVCSQSRTSNDFDILTGKRTAPEPDELDQSTYWDFGDEPSETA